MATPTLPATTGAEMQVTREFLALSRGRLANHLVLNERRMLRMEAGQEQIPQVIVSTLDDIYEETKDEVQRLTAVASESWCKSTGRFTTSPSAYGLRNSGDRPARSCR